MKKNEQSFNEKMEKYNEYFKDDLDAIEEELNKSKKYSEIIDREIDNLKGSNALTATKGSQHYLIQQIANAIALQTQRQGLRKDAFAIKKAIIDYATKFSEDEEGNKDENKLSALIEELLKSDRNDMKTLNEAPADNEGLDSEIDNILSLEESDNK